MNKRKISWILPFLFLNLWISGCGVNEPTPIPDVVRTEAEDTSYEKTTEAILTETNSESATETEAIESEPIEAAEPETDATKSEPIETAESEEKNVTILMAGDILLHSPIEDLAKNEDGSYDFHFLFRETSELIRSADIAIVNQEVIIGGKDLGISGYPSFNAPEEIGDALVDAGFDVVCHATNHALDKGKQGVLNTLSMWESKYPDMEITGIHASSDEEYRFPVIESRGIRIAILNYTYGTNGISLPPDMPYAVDLLQKDEVIKDLDEAEEIADLTVLCPHWGTEYSHEITDEQLAWIDIFRDHGADVVIGAHPHVTGPVGIQDDEGFSALQNMEEITLSNNHGDGSLLVFSSIGNFCNWTSGTGNGVADRMLGGLAEVTIQKTDSGEAAVCGFDIHPVICHVSHQREDCTVYPIERYSAALAEKNEIRNQDPAFSYEYCKNLCNEIWGDLWKRHS